MVQFLVAAVLLFATFTATEVRNFNIFDISKLITLENIVIFYYHQTSLFVARPFCRSFIPLMYFQQQKTWKPSGLGESWLKIQGHFFWYSLNKHDIVRWYGKGILNYIETRMVVNTLKSKEENQ